MRQRSLLDRLRYRFDTTLARGSTALMGWHLLGSVLLLVLATLVVWGLEVYPDRGFLRALWFNAIRALDPGAISGDENGDWGYLTAVLVVAVLGLFVFGSLIALINTAINARLAELRRGRSIVVEQGHTVVLGWSPQVLSIVETLLEGQQDDGDSSAIVVLGEAEKTDMEDAIRKRIHDRRRRATGAVFHARHSPRIVCRSGSTLDPYDVALVSPETARSIIVVSGEEEDPDTHVIKALLALRGAVGDGALGANIVAQIQSSANRTVANLAAGRKIFSIDGEELTARALVQSCRQAGVSMVLDDLLDAEGSEIYFERASGCSGLTFSECLESYSACIAIGIIRGDGSVVLNPPMDTMFDAHDQLIAIADDHTQIGRREGLRAVDRSLFSPAPCHTIEPERIVILGWSRKVPTMIRELDTFVARGSKILAVVGTSEQQREVEKVGSFLRSADVRSVSGDITDRRFLEDLGVTRHHHLIIVAESGEYGADRADARTLVALLHLRDIVDRSGLPISIAAEILESRNRALATEARADDYIVDDSIVSRMLAQMARNPMIADVFERLLYGRRSEIYFRPACEYVIHDEPVDFHTVIAAARERGEIAIGYQQRPVSTIHCTPGSLRLNPRRDEAVAFREYDRVVVLAASEG